MIASFVLRALRTAHYLNPHSTVARNAALSFLRILHRSVATAVALTFSFAISANLFAASPPAKITGTVVDIQSNPVANAHVSLYSAAGRLIAETNTGSTGAFTFDSVHPGDYRLKVESSPFVPLTLDIDVTENHQPSLTLKFKGLAPLAQSVTVFGSSPTALAPDASEQIVIHDRVLDANPGRPGAPISIPGLPIETASGGIKAPQYFAPGVAGDHGEPIGQFFQIGNFLYPNNLPANAHGNGYSDPNFLIAPIIQAVTVDGGAFNVREGNHSIDLAATYVPRPHIDSFFELTGDYRDIDLVAGWGAKNPETNEWLALEASYGNGFLERLEHRQQYKLNAFREFKFGRHDLTLFGAAYYGFSYVPGLIPINTSVPDDTVDNRQLDRTHNFMAVATDTWSIDNNTQVTFSGFLREYALQLRSNFSPDSTDRPFIGGLIQQSESRTVIGGGPLYTQKIRSWFTLLAGMDLRRDAPRNLDLRAADPNGVFHLVTSNNLTLSFLEPYAALDGALSKYFHYDIGVRREEIWMNNEDLLHPANSFDRPTDLTLPKATFTVFPAGSSAFPSISLSYGEAFHTEDPRISTSTGTVTGSATGEPTLLAPSRAYQLVIDKTIQKTEVRVTLKHVTNSQELAKIDPDTGLQEDVGPSINRVITVSLQRNFSHGSLLISYSQADARDRLTGQPVPEAPRLIWDAVATLNRLPLKLRARSEFEYVRAKPLGDGFTGVPVPEFRGAILRPFLDDRVTLSTEFLIASGYTGQTTELFAFPSDPSFPVPIERVVGVPLKSYVTASWTYHFAR